MKQSLFVCGLAVLSATSIFAQSHVSPDRLGLLGGPEARSEFFQLKRAEGSQSFADSPGFPWLAEIRFVYLDKDIGQGRVCYFGVDEGGGISHSTATRFICINDGVISETSQRAINVPRCAGRRRCNDPMPSIGIGNLRTSPIGTVADFQNPEDYPGSLALKFTMEIVSSSAHEAQ